MSDTNDTQVKNFFKERVFRNLKRLKLSQSDLARQIGLSPSVISTYKNGTYEGDVTGLEAKLAIWLGENEQSAHIETAATLQSGFVLIPTSNEILGLMRYTQRTGTIGVVVGNPGMGKTRCIGEYKRTHNNVWYATITPANKSLISVLEAVAKGVGILDLFHRPDWISNAVCKKINETKGLLIIDESQHLKFDHLEELRSIHDRTGVGLVLMGNEKVYTRMTGGHQSAEYAQLYSRIGRKLRLVQPQPGDVEAIARAYGLKDEESMEALNEIAMRPGHLREVSMILTLADAAAQGMGEKLSLKHLELAHDERNGEL